MLGRLPIKLGGVTAVLLALVVTAYWFLPTVDGQSAAAPSPSTGTETGDERRSGRTMVSALGRLAPHGEVISVGAPEGDRLARLVVTEGQHVRAGDPLAYLDAHRERLGEHQLIAARLTEAQTRLAAETRYAHALIEEATARLRQAESLPALEVQMQESRVRTLEAEVDEAERDLHRVKMLRSRELVAEQDLDRQSLSARRLHFDLAAARVLLDKRRQTLALEQSLAAAQVQTAYAALARAQGSSEIDSLREQLAYAEKRLERSVIRAPVAGEILKIMTRPGEATGARPILQMGDTATMYAVAEVYETDVALVRPRQRARITSLALPAALSGTVETVGKIVAKNAVVDIDPAAALDRRVVEVRIRLDDSRPAAQLVSLQVEVSIDVRDR